MALLFDNRIVKAISMMHNEGLPIHMAPFEEMDDTYVPFKDEKIDFEAVFKPISRLSREEKRSDTAENHPAINALRQLLECGIFNAYVAPPNGNTLTFKYLTGSDSEELSKACNYTAQELLSNTPKWLLVDSTKEEPRMGAIGGPLFEHAVDSNNLKLLNHLLASPARGAFDTRLASLDRPVDCALLQNNLAVADRLLEYSASVGNQSPYPGRALELFVTAAHSWDSLRAVELLCQHGLTKQLNQCDENGNNVLHLVIPHIKSEALQYLLEHGADALIDLPNAAGETPITSALRSARYATAKVLAEYAPRIALPAIMPQTAQNVPTNLPRLLLQRELHGNVPPRHQIQATRFGAPTPMERLALRQAILQMPTDTDAQRRQKLLAMTDPRAGLLPPDTEIERILNSPAKTELICCDRDLQHSMEHMVDGGHTLYMKPFYELAERFVPVSDERFDVTYLATAFDDAFESEMENTERARHPTMVAFRQLLDTGLFNGYIASDGDALMQLPPPMVLLTNPEMAEVVGHHQLLTALHNTPDAVLRNPISGFETPTHPLIAACKLGDLDVVKALIARGVPCNIISDHLITPLLVAVSGYEAEAAPTDENAASDGNDVGHKNNTALIEYLLAHGASRTINIPTHKSAVWGPPDPWHSTCVTPLYVATTRGDTAVVHCLLKHGAVQSIGHRDTMDPTSLHIAALYNHIEITELLLKFGCSESLAHRDAMGHTPLHIAVRQGHLDILRLLLENGGATHVNSPGKYTNALHDIHDEKMTPLMQAIYSNNPEVVELLLKHLPVDCLENVDAHDNTAMALAEKLRRHKIVDLLKQAGAVDKTHPDKARIVRQFGGGDPAFEPHQTLWIACVTGDARTAKGLLAEGAPHDWVSSNGDTLLHAVIQRADNDFMLGSPSVILLLGRLCPSSMREQKNHDGDTPLSLARRLGYSKFVIRSLKPDTE